MADIMLHTSNNTGFTCVSNTFIDDFMKDANGEYVKVYLYLLRCLNREDYDFSISQLADCLDHTEKDVMRAFTYWEKVGLLRLEYSPDNELSGIYLVDVNGTDKGFGPVISNITSLHNSVHYTPAPEAGNTGDFVAGENAEGTIEADPVETKVFIREIKIGGFSMKGALNLNNYNATAKFYTANGKNENTEQPIPNWKAYDGENDLVYEPVIFKDGRRDGKEGASDAVAENESFLGLNPCLLQTAPYEVDDADYPTKFTNTNLKGVLKTPVNLFANWTEANGYVENTEAAGCIFVIPNDKPIDIEIVYDVETVNPKLASKLSDGITPGLSVENKIRKTSTEIFNLAQAVTMQAGEFYTIKIHLGMTSVKVEAVVTPWTDLTAGDAELPYNQPK